MRFSVRRHSIFARIFFTLICLILISGLVIGVITGTAAQNMLYQNIAQSNSVLLYQIDANFSTLLTQLSAIINVSDSSKLFSRPADRAA